MQRFPLRYLAPNAITCTSISLGIISIQQSTVGEYVAASWLIVMCVLFDKLDGTVARLVNATSEFGIQMDSFSDFLTFGIAPSFLVYNMLMNTGTAYASDPMLSSALLVAIIIYTLASTLRLAKFNVLTEKIGTAYFLGFPTTLCGAVISSYILTGIKYDWPVYHVEVLPPIMGVLALFMISNIKLPKMKLPKAKIPRVFMMASFGTVYLCGLTWHYPEFLLGMGCLFLVGALTYGNFQLRNMPPMNSVENANQSESPA
jgi:CDP-diacylglycerol--serine O-phosphatidyltransferase